MAALILILALSTLSAVAAASHPFTASAIPAKLTKAVNYKGFTTYNVESRLAKQFTSVQHCLPIQLIFLETTTGVLDHAVVAVNSTSLDGSYSIHPYVEKEQLRLSLNGTVRSHDLVNVTITIPTTWGNALVNSTVTGLGFVNFALSSSPKTFQMQLAGTGTANYIMNPSSLVVSASANGSFIGGGLFDQVLLNWASTSAASLSNANDVVIQKSGSGGVYVGAVTYSTSVTQTGKGVTAITSTDTASVVQAGPGAVYVGVGTAANVSYAGGANTTYIQGTGISNSGAATADVQYTTTGNGSLLFSATAGGAYPAITVNGNALAKCQNITGWSTKACNETAVPVIPYGPDFPQKVAKCKGTWVLTDSDMCYKTPLKGYQCELVAPSSPGMVFAMVFVLIVTTAGLIWLNGL